ncbi:MAG: arginine decarboxylase, pyruvoyl-dependent [Candidatus Aminicenantales bacterium]|jgi:arginine decarboxylase
MSVIVPSKVFLTRGRGQHTEKLVSFEKALREAGIAPFNLVRVSSIYPPHCRLISRQEGVRLLKPGQILFVVLSESATDEAGRLVSASIGMAIPKDPSCYGYLAEHEGGGPTEKEAGLYTEYLAAEMLATKMGGKLKDPEKGRRAYKISNGISLETRSISRTATGEKGLWTTALAAAVLIS